VRRFVLGSYVLGLLVITVLTLMVHNLRTSFDAALDTAGSLQVRFIECEGDRLKLQASLQSCSITETLKLDMDTTRNTVVRVREINRARTDPAIKRLRRIYPLRFDSGLSTLSTPSYVAEQYLRLRVQRLRPPPNQSHR